MTVQDSPVLVTGATGKTGAALWSALKRRRIPARAMVRDGDDIARFIGEATTAVVADFDDDDAVAAALDGIRRAYLVTPSSERAEDQQLRFVEAAARAGVQHIAVLSQLGAAADSPVRFLRYHAVVERRVADLDMAYTFLRPNLYFEGLLAFAGSIARGEGFAAPIGDARVSAVAVADIAEVAAARLAQVAPDNAALTITGPQSLTHAEMAGVLSEAVGRRIEFHRVSPEDFATALDGLLPPWQIQGLVEDYAHYDRGEASATTTVVHDFTGRSPQTFKAFAQLNAAAFR